MSTAQNKPSIVFCHGLWADGSCFSKLIVPLQAEGYQCIAAQYGLNSVAEDVALTKAALGRVSSPVILVGHSYGGSVITGAGTDDRVVGLVYICALAPDADETSQTQQSNYPATPVFSHIDVKDGRIWLLPDGIDDFAGDLPEAEKKLVLATQGVPKPDLFGAKVGGTAWRSKPCWYIVGKKDRTVHPDLERAMAKRMGASTYELDSSHVPMLSQPSVGARCDPRCREGCPARNGNRLTAPPVSWYLDAGFCATPKEHGCPRSRSWDLGIHLPRENSLAQNPTRRRAAAIRRRILRRASRPAAVLRS